MTDRKGFIPKERVALGAVILVLMYAAYFRAFRGHVIGTLNDPDDWRIPAAMAAVVTLFTYMTLLALGGALQAIAERRRVSAFLDGAPYRDGEFAAVEGEARAVGTPLTAPFSGRPCLAYEYDVWMGHGPIPGKQRSGEGRGWAGWPEWPWPRRPSRARRARCGSSAGRRCRRTSAPSGSKARPK